MPSKNLLRKPSVSQVVVALLLGGLAFAITLQIKQSDTTDYSEVRGDELVELLKSLDSANERLGTQIDDLTATRNDLLSSTKRSDGGREAGQGACRAARHPRGHLRCDRARHTPADHRSRPRRSTRRSCWTQCRSCVMPAPRPS